MIFKNKTIRIFSLGMVLAGMVSLGVFMQGCSNYDEDIRDINSMEYLDVTSSQLEELSERDFEIITKAIQRLNISYNGLYTIKQTNATQVNISNKLFDIVKASYDHTNELLMSTSFSLPRLKSSTENSTENSNDSTVTSANDCVAHSVAGMGDVDYETANAWINENYGSNGIPSDKMDEVINHFYPDSKGGSINSHPGGAMNNAVIYFGTENGSGHAVNAVYYDKTNGNVLYVDPQNEGKSGIIEADKIIRVYSK